MPDFLTKADRSALMGRVKSEATAPEEALRLALRRAGARPTIGARDLPGKPDLVFRRDKLALFVDGDYWHGRQWRNRGLDHLEQQFSADSKRGYWASKIRGNVSRDLRSTAALIKQGWRVARFWEHEVEADPDAVAERVLAMRSGDEQPVPTALGISADFFAGIGLTSASIAGAGWSTAWANDYEYKKRELFRHNHAGSVTLDERSIHDVLPRSLPRSGLFTCSFPCTDLSLAGGRLGIEAGPQSSAFLRFAHILRLQRTKPEFVLLENVTALMTSHNGKDFELCLRLLDEAGYTVDAAVVDAKHFVPQSRPRLFVVGVRKDLTFGAHDPVHGVDDLPPPSDTRPERLLEFIRANPQLPWRIRPLPDLPSDSQTLESVIEQLPPDDPSWWSEQRTSKLASQLHDRHRTRLLELSKTGPVHVTGFRRMRMRDGKKQSTMELRFDGIAGCLRTPKGGSAKQVLVRAEGETISARYLSSRECARLMGVPNYRLDAEGVSENDALFGFGDAVCVPAVTWLVQNAINPLAAELIRGRLLGPY